MTDKFLIFALALSLIIELFSGVRARMKLAALARAAHPSGSTYSPAFDLQERVTQLAHRERHLYDIYQQLGVRFGADIWKQIDELQIAYLNSLPASK